MRIHSSALLFHSGPKVMRSGHSVRLDRALLKAISSTSPYLTSPQKSFAGDRTTSLEGPTHADLKVLESAWTLQARQQCNSEGEPELVDSGLSTVPEVNPQISSDAGAETQTQRLEELSPAQRAEYLNGHFTDFPEMQVHLGKALVALLLPPKDQANLVYNNFVEALYRILALDEKTKPQEIVTKLFDFHSPPRAFTEGKGRIAQSQFLSQYDFATTKDRYQALIENLQQLEALLAALDGDLPMQRRNIGVIKEQGQQVDYAKIARGVLGLGASEELGVLPEGVMVQLPVVPGFSPLVPFSRRTRAALQRLQPARVGNGREGLASAAIGNEAGPPAGVPQLLPRPFVPGAPVKAAEVLDSVMTGESAKAVSGSANPLADIERQLSEQADRDNFFRVVAQIIFGAENCEKHRSPSRISLLLSEALEGPPHNVSESEIWKKLQKLATLGSDDLSELIQGVVSNRSQRQPNKGAISFVEQALAATGQDSVATKLEVLMGQFTVLNEISRLVQSLGKPGSGSIGLKKEYWDDVASAWKCEIEPNVPLIARLALEQRVNS